MKTLLLLLLSASVQAASLTVNVDLQAQRHPISSNIYGVNGGDPVQLARMGATVSRWGGGNPSTRYNWKNNVANRAKDYYFESIPNSNGPNTDAFASSMRGAGVQPLIPVTTVGWINKDTSSKLCGFSVAKYGAQQGADGDCGNGIQPGHAAGSCDFLPAATDPTDTSFAANEAWTQEWVQHLAPEGVHLYELDNEPGLWNCTHHDVHPARTSYAEMKSALWAHGAAIKAADPQALTLGPSSWGWTEYFYLTYSPAGNPDHDTYGDFLPWYLDAAKAYSDAHGGARVLDYLDVHVYPQVPGVYSSDVSPGMVTKRLNSTRSLWDPTYSESMDGSWISGPVRLIPRMHEWVDAHDPGTRLSITEYSWGVPDHWSGALAQADILGIFGREGLDLATLFWIPDGSSGGGLGEDAFKLYRNYDGAGARFGDTSVQASSPDPVNLSAYAAETGAGTVTVALINKSAAASTVTVAVAGVTGGGHVRAFTFGQSGRLQAAPGVESDVTTPNVQLTVPAFSAEVLELVPKVPSVPDAGAGNGSGGGNGGGSPGGDAGTGPHAGVLNAPVAASCNQAAQVTGATLWLCFLVMAWIRRNSRRV